MDLKYKGFDGHELDITIPPCRCAVLPYFISNTGKIYLVFGIDRNTGDITDWGGSVKPGETSAQAAGRELGEESCGIIIINDDIIAQNPAVYNCYQLSNDDIINSRNSAITFFCQMTKECAMNFPVTFAETNFRTNEMVDVKILSILETYRSLEQGAIYYLICDNIAQALGHLSLLESKLIAQKERESIKAVIKK